MGRSQDRNFSLSNLFPVSIPHFVIPGYQHPAILMAESNHLGILYVLPSAAVLIAEPFGKSLDGESSRSKTHCDRFGGETLVEEQNAFLTPLFDVGQCG